MSLTRSGLHGASWLLGLWLCLGCRGERYGEVRLVVDEGAPRNIAFTPTIALAEYQEVPDRPNELRLTLASFDARCDSYVSPAPGSWALTLLIVTPPGVRPTPGDYSWAGHAPDGSRPRLSAMPKLLTAGKSYEFQPGGSVELTRVDFSMNGGVSGLLHFAHAGDGSHVATRIEGVFTTKLCHVELVQEK